MVLMGCYWKTGKSLEWKLKGDRAGKVGSGDGLKFDGDIESVQILLMAVSKVCLRR